MRNKKTHAATEPPKTKKSNNRNIILGFGLTGSATCGAAFAVGPFASKPEGGNGASPGETGPGIGGLLPPRGGSPGGAADGKLGVGDCGTKPGLVAPKAGAMPGFVAPVTAGDGERDGGAVLGEGWTGGTVGAGTATLEGAPAGGGAAGDGAPGGGAAGDGAPGGGLAEAGVAKGCLVTLNLGAPGAKGLTGSPSLGINLRDGRGGSGVGADILAKKEFYFINYESGVFFLIKSEISSIEASSRDLPFCFKSSNVLQRVSVIWS